MNPNEHKIVPISIPGIHQAFYPYFLKKTAGKKISVLDAGAGHGAFTKKLFDEGYTVSACDIFPEYYYYDKVPVKQADITQHIPFDDNSFDAIISLEVMEHVQDHSKFFAEAARVLKKDGMLFVSTPNILSLKSRIRFLFSGFFYSFTSLDHDRHDGLQHVASLTLDQYNRLALIAGFEQADYFFDKEQSTSKAWLWLYPFLWLYAKLKKTGMMHNSYGLLTGRILFMMFKVRK
jgi:SAM-dependent methyltransferase